MSEGKITVKKIYRHQSNMMIVLQNMTRDTT